MSYRMPGFFSNGICTTGADPPTADDVFDISAADQPRPHVKPPGDKGTHDLESNPRLLGLITCDNAIQVLCAPAEKGARQTLIALLRATCCVLNSCVEGRNGHQFAEGQELSNSAIPPLEWARRPVRHPPLLARIAIGSPHVWQFWQSADIGRRVGSGPVVWQTNECGAALVALSCTPRWGRKARQMLPADPIGVDFQGQMSVRHWSRTQPFAGHPKRPPASSIRIANSLGRSCGRPIAALRWSTVLTFLGPYSTSRFKNQRLMRHSIR